MGIMFSSRSGLRAGTFRSLLVNAPERFASLLDADGRCGRKRATWLNALAVRAKHVAILPAPYRGGGRGVSAP